MVQDLSGCKILLVDDIKINISILVQALKNDYELAVAPNGEAALQYINAKPVDLILLDIMMPGMDGFEVCARIKENPKTQSIPIIFITAMNEPGDKTRGFEMGAVDYITKPFYIAEVKARVKNHLALKLALEALENQNLILDEKVRERTRELEESQKEIISRLAMAGEYHDRITGNHVKRVSEFCKALSEAAGLARDEVELIGLASSMHDIGKIAVSPNILKKPGRLDQTEWDVMKLHPLMGAELLSGSDSKLLQAASVIALTHHEHWDGSGYPKGLKGEEIPLYGRIAGICDLFDALTTERPYKEIWSLDKAFEEINKKSGILFDPHLAELFVGLRSRIEQILKEFG